MISGKEEIFGNFRFTTSNTSLKKGVWLSFDWMGR